MLKDVHFFLPRLSIGGAERATLALLPSLRAQGYRPTVVVASSGGELEQELPPDVNLISLNVARCRDAVGPLSRLLRRTRPAVLVSSLNYNNITAALACVLARIPTKLIFCQHGIMSKQLGPPGRAFDRLLPRLYKLCARRAAAIVAVSGGAATDMAHVTGIPRERITHIYNPVVSSNFAVLADQPVDHPFFATGAAPVFSAVGRLVDSKDYVTLIDAFARFRTYTDGRLVIIGDGPLYADLTDHVRRRGLAKNVALIGAKRNPLKYMRRSSAVVMSSRHEGLGNVLIEALAVGTPVISTDCPYGPAEILEQGRYGTLVPVGDVNAMAEAMRAVIKVRPHRASLRQRAAAFTTDAVAARYVQLFESLTRA